MLRVLGRAVLLAQDVKIIFRLRAACDRNLADSIRELGPWNVLTLVQGSRANDSALPRRQLVQHLAHLRAELRMQPNLALKLELTVGNRQRPRCAARAG